MGDVTDSDAYLVRAVLAGSQEAGDRLFRRHMKTFRSALYSWRHRSDYEDLRQEALLHLYRKLDRWDATRPFGAWSYQVLHNHACGALRSPRWRERHYRFLDPAQYATPEAPEAADPSEGLPEAFGVPEILRRIEALLKKAGSGLARELLAPGARLGDAKRQALSRLRRRLAELIRIQARGPRRSVLLRRHLERAILSGKIGRECFE